MLVAVGGVCLAVPPVSHRNQKYLGMAQASEILFIDPSVSDLGTILRSLRPQLEAMVLGGDRPAASQIAAALAGREGSRRRARHLSADGCGVNPQEQR